MADDGATVEHLAREARACADGLWEVHGPGAEPFRGEDAEFADIPEDVLESMEMDLGRPLTEAERRAMAAAFHGRVAELLRGLIAKATRIMGLVNAAKTRR